jgi:hypothetical protein
MRFQFEQVQYDFELKNNHGPLLPARQHSQMDDLNQAEQTLRRHENKLVCELGQK